MAGSRKGKARAAAQDEPVTAALPLGKQLAHTDKKVRDRAIASLIAFLSAGDQTSGTDDENGAGPSGYKPLVENEMDKLWKGLFYCFWMSDKPLVQQALAASLAELLLQIDPLLPASASTLDRQSARFEASLGFLAGFWRAIIREWIGIDRLRMDKFYMLIRRYTNASFRLLAREGWAPESIRGLNDVLGGPDGPLRWDNTRLSTSISTHLADVWLDELDAALARPEVDSQGTAPLIPLLSPLITLLARTPSKTVHDRLMTTLFTPLLSALQLASPTVDESEPPSKKHRTEPMYPHIVMRCCVGSTSQDKASEPDKLRGGVLKAMFQEAAKEGAVESNRRKMYKLWREEGGDDEDEEEDDDEA